MIRITSSWGLQRGHNINNLIFCGRSVPKQFSSWSLLIGIGLLCVAQITLHMVKHNATEAKGSIATVLEYNPHKRYQIWRYGTYMLVHENNMHLYLNMTLQIFLGIWLQIVHKWWRVLVIYFAGVLAGSLLTSLVKPTVYLIGCSGGAYALCTAHIASIIMNWKNKQDSCSLLVFFLIVTVLAIGVDVINCTNLQFKENISIETHLAGFVAGFLVGIGITGEQNVNSWKKQLWWMSLLLYAILMISAVSWNIFRPDYFPKQL